MANYGIKISKAGYDVLTAALQNQIFNSQANSLKIYMVGSVNITIGGSSGLYTATVAHNLGYMPFFLVYFKIKDANKLWLQESLDNSRLLANFDHGYVYADTTNLTLNIQTDDVSYTATAYYVIFVDKAYE